MNGVIWSKTQDTFVPIFSIPAFAVIRQERLRQSRELEVHNFRLQNLTLTSFNEPGFFEFINNSSVTGLCGDMWTLLSHYLNFTLQPVKANVDTLGVSDKGLVYTQGLLGMIFRNETIAIPKVETYASRLAATDFTIPLWMGSHELYVRHELIHDNTWMIKVFTWDLWCIILLMHIILTTCNFWSQYLLALPREKWKVASFNELLFYSFGNLCNQSYTPMYLESRSKILEVSLGLFCSVMNMAFGAMLFNYISKGLFMPPFDSLENLLYKTKYNVLCLKGSIEDLAIQAGPTMPFPLLKMSKRVIVLTTAEKMFKKICTVRNKYAVFQGTDVYSVKRNRMCQLVSTDVAYLQMWVASGVQRHFKYKRSIDIGILKLKETGLLTALKRRWFLSDFEQNNLVKTPKAIEIDQVSLMIMVMGCGVVMALVILIIEKAVFIYTKHKRS